MTRTGRDVTSQYPELHMIHELVNQVNAVVDAEIVAFDEEGKNSFEALQQRMNLSNEREIKRMTAQVPVALVAFDLLWLDGRDLTTLKLEERRELLEAIVEPDHRLQLVTHVEGTGTAFTDVAKQLGLEGVVAKKVGSRYHPGRRSPDWRKIKLTNTQDCVILGWTAGQGGRSGTFGALFVGAYLDGKLLWIGQVGTGFTEAMLQRVMAELEPLVRPTPATEDPELGQVKGATFVEPRVVCEVEYLEITKVDEQDARPELQGHPRRQGARGLRARASRRRARGNARRVRSPRARAARGPRARRCRAGGARGRSGPRRGHDRISGSSGSGRRRASRTRGIG